MTREVNGNVAATAEQITAATAEAFMNMPAPVVAVQDIITKGNDYVRVRDAASF